MRGRRKAEINPELISELESRWSAMGNEGEAGKLAAQLVTAQKRLKRTPYLLAVAGALGVGLGVLGTVTFGPRTTPAEQTLEGHGLENIPTDEAGIFEYSKASSHTAIAVWCDLAGGDQAHGTLHTDPMVADAIGKAILYPDFASCPMGAIDYTIPSDAVLATLGLQPMVNGH